MFNNPFSSFHDTVSEAKEEREQLDRLLTVSTPRERLLVALIALLLFILTAWLFFGSVSRSLAVGGVLIDSVETPLEGDRSVQALVWVGNDVAPLIEVGMPTLIELDMTGGGTDPLGGQIAAVSAVPLSESLSSLKSVSPISAHRIEISLDEGLNSTFLAGRECRIVIELGRQSPIVLLGLRRP